MFKLWKNTIQITFCKKCCTYGRYKHICKLFGKKFYNNDRERLIQYQKNYNSEKGEQRKKHQKNNEVIIKQNIEKKRKEI